jgi:hypothetical protein
VRHRRLKFLRMSCLDEDAAACSETPVRHIFGQDVDVDRDFCAAHGIHYCDKSNPFSWRTRGGGNARLRKCDQATLMTGFPNHITEAMYDYDFGYERSLFRHEGKGSGSRLRCSLAWRQCCQHGAESRAIGRGAEKDCPAGGSRREDRNYGASPQSGGRDANGWPSSSSRRNSK